MPADDAVSVVRRIGRPLYVMIGVTRGYSLNLMRVPISVRINASFATYSDLVVSASSAWMVGEP